MTRVAFLYNHHAPHQVLHTAPVAFALSELYPGLEVEVIASCDHQLAMARRIGSGWPSHRVRFRRMVLPPRDGFLRRTLSADWPVSKRRVLHANRSLLASFDAIVVPERTSTALRAYRELDHVQLILIPHGAGDRAKGYEPRNALFDLVLVPGDKCRRRFIADVGLHPAKVQIIGYPKLDVPACREQWPLFPERRPTVLYNPHFDRRLSSWPRLGRQVLDWFADQRTYNLIFAPHIMLYRRRIKSLGRPLRRYRGLSHIRIDVGSDRCVDMTYTRHADIYLGDVSSQVYEFVRTPRPAVFLNAPPVTGWAADPNYRHWSMGTVVERLEELPDALGRPLTAELATVQWNLVDETFWRGDLPPSSLGARAIAEHLAAGKLAAGRPPRPSLRSGGRGWRGSAAQPTAPM